MSVLENHVNGMDDPRDVTRQGEQNVEPEVPSQPDFKKYAYGGNRIARIILIGSAPVMAI